MKKRVKYKIFKKTFSVSYKKYAEEIKLLKELEMHIASTTKRRSKESNRETLKSNTKREILHAKA